MFQKIVAFFMSIFTAIAAFFGIGGGTTPTQTDRYQKYANVKYGQAERQVLDFYLPDGAAGDTGVVLMIHGGAWIAGSKEDFSGTAEYTAAYCGVPVITMNYRYLSSTTDMYDILDDITLALNKACALASQNGVTLKKLMTMGYSAGAHLALLYAYSKSADSPVKPVCVYSLAGPTDLTDSGFYYNSSIGSTDEVCQLMSMACGKTVTPAAFDSVRDALLDISPIKYVDTAVPTIVCHGEKDTIVPYSNATELVYALKQRSITCDFFSYPDRTHDLGNYNDANEKAIEYINTYLK